MVPLFKRAYRAIAGSSNTKQVVRRACCCVEDLESRRMLAVYYVSAAGSDSNSGTSLTAAWKSINRVNSQTLRSGDAVLFRSGDTFNGNLVLTSSEGGTKFTTTGSGKANINSTAHGFELQGAGNVLIKNFSFKGPGATGNDRSGIYAHTTASNQTVSNIEISQVDSYNYGRYGVEYNADDSGAKFSNIKTIACTLRLNGTGGLGVFAASHNKNTGVYVGWVWAYDNPGRTDRGGITGSGIFVADTDGATIERCVARNNGANGLAPVGIWTAGSRRVVIQHNESYSNRSRSGTDGGGIHLDVDTSDSVIQYNYTHDNYGPGYSLVQTSTNTYYGNNTIRFNVSQNDGRRNGRGGIHLWGKIRDSQIYNNTVYMSSGSNSDSATFRAHNVGAGSNSAPSNVTVRNNIFYTKGGVKLLNITAATAGGFKFLGNDYYSGGSAFNLNFGGTNYTSLSSFANAKNQEKSGSSIVGLSTNPLLSNAGGGQTLGDANKLNQLSAYKLSGSSPLINKGFSPVSGVTVSSKNTDFFGDSVPRGGRYDLGADEVA